VARNKTSGIVAAAAALFCVTAAANAKTDRIETAGTIVAVALPVAAGSVTAFKHDWSGLAQLAVVTAATVGTAFALKHVVHEERPDHSDDQSFPSDTSALAFAPAQFLWRRYGWEYGAPAYAAAAFVGYSRVESKQHHWWDVAASAGLSWGYNRFITTEYTRPDLYGGAYLTPGGGYVSLSYRW
jgi:membrane-associated phospholipid phosphatase